VIDLITDSATNKEMAQKIQLSKTYNKKPCP
jgi:hypothetical protein